MATNPFIGAAWQDPSQQGQNPFGQNPLLSLPQVPGGVGALPGGDDTTDNDAVMRNAMLNNVFQGQLKNALLPQFADASSKFAGPAGDFFKKLMDLGSPYYAQKQQEGFTQGVKANDDAGALARQELDAKGYGYTPSGAQAGMIGSMAMKGSQSLAEMYLKNLFQNENLQATGASGMMELAKLFNPASLFGTIGAGGSTPPTQDFAQQFQSIMAGLGVGNGGGGISVNTGGGGGVTLG